MSLLDWIIPGCLTRDPEIERRARAACGFTLISIGVTLGLAFRYWLTVTGPERFLLSLLLLLHASVCAMALLFVRRTGRLELGVHLVVGYAFVHLSIVAYLLGGLDGPVLYWCLLLPMTSTFAGSARSGLVCLVICALVYAGFTALALGGHLPDPPPGAEPERLWVGSLSALLVATFGFALVFERAKERALAMLRRSNVALTRARDATSEHRESKSALLARVSHEIRTPMTAIVGFSDLLGERLDAADPASRSVEAVRRNARHLLEVVNDILELSKIEAGEMQIQIEPCDPTAITREVLGRIRVRARARGVGLHCTYEDPIPCRVLIDPDRLKQILTNVVANAIKLSAGGEVAVTVRTLSGPEDTRWIRLEVRDTGIGMLREQLDRLFEPFAAADATTVRRFGGTGLGLSISRELCRRMGGDIHAESTPGEGSSFRIDLPLNLPDEEPCVVAGVAPPLNPPDEEARSVAGVAPTCEAGAAPESRPAGDDSPLRTRAPLPGPGGRRRVLYADDRPESRELVLTLLGRSGAEVAVAVDGTQALEIACGAAQPFDVILLDLEMPGASGFDVVRTLRERGHAGPILALSARVMAGEQKRCLDAGFDALIPKPFEPAALLEAVDRPPLRSAPPRGIEGSPAPAVDPPAAAERTIGRWDRLARRFLPADLRADPAEQQRVRMVVGLAWAPVPVALLWALVLPRSLDHQIGVGLGWMLAAAVPLLVAVPLLYRRTGSTWIASNGLLAYALVLTGVLTYCGGGVGARSSYWLLLLPMSVLFVGPKVGLAWTGLALGMCFGFQFLERTVPLTDMFLSEHREVLAALSAGTLTALATALIVQCERTQRTAIHELAHMNEELRTAQKAAENASRSQSDFITNVSHELRTPMTAILGFSELLVEEWREGDVPADLRRGAELIHRSGQHLLALIEDLLDFGRVEAGRVQLDRIDYDPSVLRNEVAELMRVRADAKHLELCVRTLPPVPERVRGDPTRVRQILMNLLSNAIKFTRSGRVEMRLRARAGWLEFEVEDTGIGMTAAEQATLFEPFRQGAAARAQAEPGTGLGLAICERLSALMGGDIYAESRAGEGSCFRLALPMEPTAACGSVLDAVSPGPEPGAVHAPEAPRGPCGYRVLLAEDGPDNQLLITRLLGRAGISVTLAANGKLALEEIDAAEERGEPFDLVLMDMQMPVLDGYGAVRELRRRGSSLPVIALTAHALGEERVRCLEAGCDAFATKPIRRNELVDLVHEWAQPK